ncbi:MAG TPA: hypothetical protein VK619_16400 [Pyrinomonadaceae bacterium]|nr:hypothetical protein [Pyrinomonadaceae bacterium]
MKPLISEVQDTNTLQELGRASVQIVHDLKNQLNGLKLYATFLRKRMEKGDRPIDEQETVGKLINGLERAASDMTLLVRYGRPIELRRQPGVSLGEIVRSNSSQEQEGIHSIHINAGDDALEGEFDVTALTESFRAITTGALKLRPAQAKEPVEVNLHRESDGSDTTAIIEWRGLQIEDELDPFHSFAGSDGLRMAMASKIIEAHGGKATTEGGDKLIVRLPVKTVK